MKTDTLKKSLLDYAIKGKLTARFRRENSGLSAFDEISTYNEAIKAKRKSLEKELKKCEKEFKLEKDKDKKAFFKSQIQILKKEIAKCKEITPLNLSEAPFTIPNSWAWVKLGDICEIFTGATPKTSNAENFGDFIPFLNPGDIDNNGNVIYSNRGLTEKGLKEARKIEANSILVVCIGGLIGKACLVDRECTCNQQINVAKPLFTEATLLYYFINSAYFQSTIKTNSTGTATPIINKNLFEQILIPLPPLCEQQEIVKKLDLLVTLANDFAITKENLKRIEKRIEKSLLKLALEGRLSKLYRRNSPTLSAFDEINTYNEAIKEKRKELEKELKKLESTLKKVGKRDFSPTAQNDKQKTTQSKASLENDKNATCHTEPLGEVSKTTESQLVIFSECEKSTKEIKQNLKSQIQALKKEIVKCKEITPLFCQESRFFANAQNDKKACHTTSPCHTDLECSEREVSNNTESKRDFSPTAQNDNPHTPPFEIPNSWAWVKGYDIFLPIDNTEPQGDFFKYIDIDSIDNKNKKVKSPKTIETKNASSRARRPLEYGDVLFSMVRPYLENIALIDEALADCIASTGFFVCRTNILDSRFLYYLMTSPYVGYGLNSFMKGDNSPSIVKDDILNFNYPLPPLCEQEHIVQILDTLFTLKKGLRVE